ncbi:hypothetical protein KQI65_10895 [bacterium]|nr:hypothetical protein [bacterium]
MKNVGTAVLLIILILAAVDCTAQQTIDVLHLKNGSRIRGQLIEMIPNDHATIRTQDGSEHVYKFDEIASIQKELAGEPTPMFDGAGEFEWDRENMDIMDMPYSELGINIGTPGGLNLAYGHWFGGIGLRLSGMIYGPSLSGLQLNLGFKLSDTYRMSHVLALVGGVSHFELEEETYYSSYSLITHRTRVYDWTYLGGIWEMNWWGFFLQTGLAVGSGDFSNPQLMLQIGYMYRFLD